MGIFPARITNRCRLQQCKVSKQVSSLRTGKVPAILAEVNGSDLVRDLGGRVRSIPSVTVNNGQRKSPEKVIPSEVVRLLKLEDCALSREGNGRCPDV